jgi:hypothetical protein
MSEPKPMYVSDWRKLEDEIVTALQEQGYSISKNADGDLCCEGQVNITRLAQALKRVVIEATILDKLRRKDF